MSVVTSDGRQVAQAADLVTVTIDGIEVGVPKGTLAIRAAEKIGVAIPRFCDHPLLDPVGACRECLVEVTDVGNGRGLPKPQPACTLEVAPGMKFNTQRTSPVAAKAQAGQIEFLLINHPLDCPVCDKGGECPLQNQALANGRGESRFEGVKRTFPKPVNVSAQVLLDRERCVLCARCTRFSEQISGDPFIELVERGALQQVGIYENQPYDSYFSGNVIQICPVGALTSAAYRFQARPFDLVSTTSTCEHCASGCELRIDHRHYQVKRRLAGDKPEVNEEWNCDVGRFAFVSARLDDRLTRPLIREDGQLRVASWPEAIDAAVAGLKAARSNVGVLTGGRLTTETAYAYSRFTRAVLGTNNIDFRARALSVEEEQFLSHHVAGRPFGDVTYADLETASQVVLVNFEPEDESPIVFLRLRKAVRKNGLRVVTVAPFLSRGSQKLKAALVGVRPGEEPTAVSELQADSGTVILVGERAATSAGTLSAVVALAQRSGARLAWIPRRAGEVGAIEAGCLPTLLPGGRPLSDPKARLDVALAWGVGVLPAEAGLDTLGMLDALRQGDLKAALVSGVELKDLPDPAAAREALEAAEFVVSLESRLSEVAERADVVLPVALLEEQSGSFLNWERRRGMVERVNKQVTRPMTDLKVLAALADALGHDLGFRTPAAALEQLDELGPWEGERVAAPSAKPGKPSRALVLASWRQLIDDSRHNDGETGLLLTARPAVALVSAKTRASAKLDEYVTLATDSGKLTVPVRVEPSMVDGVVWLPARTAGISPNERLGLGSGDEVRIAAGKGGAA